MKPLLNLNDMAEAECREFVLSEKGDETKCFVIKIRNRYFAYQNQCPHAGVELNWQENRFLDYFGTHFQCTLHGALFQIEDGRCIWGPCLGQALKPIATIVKNDRLYPAGND